MSGVRGLPAAAAGVSPSCALGAAPCCVRTLRRGFAPPVGPSGPSAGCRIARACGTGDIGRRRQVGGAGAGGVSVNSHAGSALVSSSSSSSGSSSASTSSAIGGCSSSGERGDSKFSAQQASANPLRFDARCLPPSMQPVATLVASIFGAVVALSNAARNAFAACFPQIAQADAEDVKAQLKSLANTARLAAFIAPFAKAAASESLTAVYTRTFERAAFGFAKMYLFCLFMRVLLSWFPSIDWNAQPWTFLRLITEPYLQIYRGILPPLFGQLDFTPLLGFLILQDVVEVMAPTYTMGMHAGDTSTRWTTSDVMCYFDGF